MVGQGFTPSSRSSQAGSFKLADPLVTRMAKRQLESDLANLKDLMEAHAF
jgi:hypothetical protein